MEETYIHIVKYSPSYGRDTYIVYTDTEINISNYEPVKYEYYTGHIVNDTHDYGRETYTLLGYARAMEGTYTCAKQPGLWKGHIYTVYNDTEINISSYKQL